MVECVTAPLTPVTVKAYVPGGVAGPSPMLNVEEPGPVTDSGARLDLVPAGMSVTLRLIGVENPLDVAMLMPKFVLSPMKRLAAGGTAEI